MKGGLLILHAFGAFTGTQVMQGTPRQKEGNRAFSNYE